MPFNLLNYFIIDCYQNKLAKKYETESKISKKDYFFKKKWIFSPDQKYNQYVDRTRK